MVLRGLHQTWWRLEQRQNKCGRKLPSLVGLLVVCVRVVHGTAQFHERHLEILRVGVPRFLEFGRDDHVGPQGSPRL